MSEVGQKLIKATRAAAEANPDKIYELATIHDEIGNVLKQGKCRYVHEGKPSCIVGHAAWDIELIDADLEGDPTGNNEASVDILLEYLDLDVDSTEAYWLSTVQGAQDRGAPWGESVEAADRRHPECAES
jgi:hypothetical protein